MSKIVCPGFCPELAVFNGFYGATSLATPVKPTRVTFRFKHSASEAFHPQVPLIISSNRGHVKQFDRDIPKKSRRRTQGGTGRGSRNS
jgi:hypothetical protein